MTSRSSVRAQRIFPRGARPIVAAAGSLAAALDDKEHPSTKIKRATRPPIGGASQVRGEGPIPRDVDRSRRSDHEPAWGRERLRATLIVREDDTFPAKSTESGAWRARTCGCRTALVTTTRSRPALRVAVASGVDLAANDRTVATWRFHVAGDA
jgi:hypothetical protein